MERGPTEATSLVDKSATGVAEKAPALPSTGYRADIDGLRSIAVSAVFIFHVHSYYLPGGFLGVDMFYCISGYVVFGSLLQHRPLPSNNCEYFTAFYARRLKRLIPALSFFVAFTALFPLYLLLQLSTAQAYMDTYYDSGMLAEVGLANFKYALQESSYWEATSTSVGKNIYLHCWSLGVEEQFYFFFPGMVLFLYHRYLVLQEAKTDPASKEDASWWPQVVLGVVAFASWVANGYGAHLADQADPDGFNTDLWGNYVFYLLPFRFWQLLGGAMITDVIILHPQFVRRCFYMMPAFVAKWIRPMLSIVIVLVFVLGMIYDNDTVNETGRWYWATGTSAITLTYFLLGALDDLFDEYVGTETSWLHEPWVNRLLATKPFVFVGKISYQIYLWHWPTIIICNAILADPKDSLAESVVSLLVDSDRTSYGPTPSVKALVVVLAFVFGGGFAMFSYYVIEGPSRKWRPAKHWHAIVAMFGVIGAVEGWVTLVHYGLPNLHAETPSNLTSADRSGFRDFILTAGDVSVPTIFGRTKESGCACRYVDGVETRIRPASVVTDADAPLCFSTYPAIDNDYATDFEDFGCVTGKSDAPSAEAFTQIATACWQPDRADPNLPTKTIFVFGDSTVMPFDVSIKLAARAGFQVRSISFEGTELRSLACLSDAHQAALFNKLQAEMRPGDVLVLKYVYIYGYEDTYGIDPSITKYPECQDDYANVTKIMDYVRNVTATIIKPAGASLMIFGPPPTYNYYGEDLMADTGIYPTEASVAPLVAEFPGVVHFAPLAPTFVPTDGTLYSPFLLPYFPGQFAFYDEVHLTSSGSVYIWPFVCQMLEDAGLF